MQQKKDLHRSSACSTSALVLSVWDTPVPQLTPLLRQISPHTRKAKRLAVEGIHKQERKGPSW